MRWRIKGKGVSCVLVLIVEAFGVTHLYLLCEVCVCLTGMRAMLGHWCLYLVKGHNLMCLGAFFHTLAFQGIIQYNMNLIYPDTKLQIIYY